MNDTVEAAINKAIDESNRATRAECELANAKEKFEKLRRAAQAFYDARPYSIRHSGEGEELAAELQRYL